MRKWSEQTIEEKIENLNDDYQYLKMLIDELTLENQMLRMEIKDLEGTMIRGFKHI